MIAVFRHELRSYFHSLTAYVFGAFLLALVGLGSMLYNIQAAVSNFEYVLAFSSLVFVVIVPLLTMRTMAEERKQKTDQLLYALPLSGVQVVLGKYLALLLLFALPMVVIGCYPLLFSQFGPVYLPTSYGSILAFFLLGAALIAVGVFISSLTDNQGLAAGIGVAVILLNYYSVSLSEFVSSSAIGTAIALLAAAVLLALVVRFLTGSRALALGIGAALAAVTLLLCYSSYDTFQGLLPRLMSSLSLFDRFNGFVNGVFDITTLVYYLTVAAGALFLTVQSLEKRRYH